MLCKVDVRWIYVFEGTKTQRRHRQGSLRRGRMQAACWYVLLLLQPTVYLVSRGGSGASEIPLGPGGQATGGAREECEAASSARTVFLVTVLEQLWEADLWIPAGFSGVPTPIAFSSSPFPKCDCKQPMRAPQTSRNQRSGGTRWF